jgi:TolB-like protein/DNA-binding winged helix-turn-helix (wHTH) protein
MSASSDIYLFADFRLDRAGGGLFRRDDSGALAPVTIGSRALDLLAVLIERRGDVVSKEEIMTAVWPRTAVEEANLFAQISALRAILDKEQSGQSCIQTVIGRGYRFIAPVARCAAGMDSPHIPPDPSEHPQFLTQDGAKHSAPLANARSPEPQLSNALLHAVSLVSEPLVSEHAPPLPLPEKPSIAVLPFQNMSGDPAQDYFADGMVEDIVTGLSRIRWLFVIARQSSFVYRGKSVGVQQIGRELGVRYLLEGSVRKSETRLRVTAQLIEAATGAHLWADKFDGNLKDVFDLQDHITERVVGIVEPSVQKSEIERSRRKRPESLDDAPRARGDRERGGRCDRARHRRLYDRPSRQRRAFRARGHPPGAVLQSVISRRPFFRRVPLRLERRSREGDRSGRARASFESFRPANVSSASRLRRRDAPPGPI